MKHYKRNGLILLIGIILLVVAIFLKNSPRSIVVGGSGSLKIASWNMWDFSGAFTGTWKTESDGITCVDYVCQGYSDVITSGEYDLVFVQEIKSKKMSDGTITYPGFDDFCSRFLAGSYTCVKLPATNNTDTGGNKEGYGIIISNNINLGFRHNTFKANIPGMKRPPSQTEATITTPNGSEIDITIFNNHIVSKGRTYQELIALQNYIVNLEDDTAVIVLGDLNTGKPYYNKSDQARASIFPDRGWEWLIRNDQKTNFLGASAEGGYKESNKGYAYDRFIASRNLRGFYSTAANNIGIVDKIPNQLIRTDGTVIAANTYFKDVIWNGRKHYDVYGLSDHKLIWFNLLFGGVHADDVHYYNATCLDDSSKDVKPVTITGEGFPPDLQDMTVYVIKSSKTSTQLTEGFLLNSSFSAPFSRRVHTDSSGALIADYYFWNSGIIWNQNEDMGYFNIVVDMDNDGQYNSNIDIIDKSNGYSFMIETCEQPTKRQRINAATSESATFGLF